MSNDINEEKTTPESGGQNGSESATYYEKARKSASSLESWDEIADVELLCILLTGKNLTYTEKEFILSILAEKSKRLKMYSEFKKILSQ